MLPGITSKQKTKIFSFDCIKFYHVIAYSIHYFSYVDQRHLSYKMFTLLKFVLIYLFTLVKGKCKGQTPLVTCILLCSCIRCRCVNLKLVQGNWFKYQNTCCHLLRNFLCFVLITLHLQCHHSQIYHQNTSRYSKTFFFCP